MNRTILARKYLKHVFIFYRSRFTSSSMGISRKMPEYAKDLVYTRLAIILCADNNIEEDV